MRSALKSALSLLLEDAEWGSGSRSKNPRASRTWLEYKARLYRLDIGDLDSAGLIPTLLIDGTYSDARPLILSISFCVTGDRCPSRAARRLASRWAACFRSRSSLSARRRSVSSP